MRIKASDTNVNAINTIIFEYIESTIKLDFIIEIHFM